MKIKATKVFADFINRTAKETGKKFYASIVKMSERGYCINLGSRAVWDAESYGDFDWSKDQYTALRIEYPENYYALPKYVSTKELVSEFRRRNIQDADGLKEMIVDMLEI